jgi:methyl-accepting chemotaxis protein
MHELSGRVGQITTILNVIEEIAGQTNLLSLNAAIIAAQAGEHGAGFTVVADEIRQLSDRTRKSTTEINGIIRAVQQSSREAAKAIDEGVERVGDNVRLAMSATGSLVRIQEIADRVAEMARHMRDALTQQGTAANHLRSSSATMAEHTNEINRATQQQAESTGMLAAETERVRDIVGQVKNSTREQSTAARGITMAMEAIASDVGTMRDLLQQQLTSAEQIDEASTQIHSIATSNSAIAREFSETVGSILESGSAFEKEVARFRLGGSEHEPN